MLIYFHIEKTGGTTIREVVKSLEPPKRFYIYDVDGTHEARMQHLKEHQGEYDLIFGHMPYGAHVCFDTASYATFLRDPVRRFVSHYKHWYEWGQGSYSKYLRENEINLKFFTKHVRAQTDISNLVTRRLCGIEEPCYVDEEHYKTALERLMKFDYVGFLDKDFHVYVRRFIWKYFQVPDVQVGRFMVNNSWRHTEHDDETIDIIKNLNKWDILLYEQALQRFGLKNPR